VSDAGIILTITLITVCVILMGGAPRLDCTFVDQFIARRLQA
jgi:hypothetical protein